MAYTKLNVAVDGKAVYVNSASVKVGSKGKSLQVGDLLAYVEKGKARQIRKALHDAGKVYLASTKRVQFNGPTDPRWMKFSEAIGLV